MKMNKERYEDLLLRFAKELDDVGVTDDMKKIVSAQADRTPNVASAGADFTSARFVYRHDGYLIEAVQSVKLTVRKCD